MNVTATLCSVALTRGARSQATAASRHRSRCARSCDRGRAVVLGAGAAPRPPASVSASAPRSQRLPQSAATPFGARTMGYSRLGTSPARLHTAAIGLHVRHSLHFQPVTLVSASGSSMLHQRYHSAIGAAVRYRSLVLRVWSRLTSRPATFGSATLMRRALGRAGASVASTALATSAEIRVVTSEDILSVEERPAGRRVKGAPQQSSGHRHGGAEPPSCQAHPIASGAALTIRPVQGARVAIAPARPGGAAEATQEIQTQT